MLDQLYSTIMKHSLAAVLLLSLLCLGCGASKEIVETHQEKPKERRAPLADYEATLNPVDFEKEIDAHVEKAPEKTTSSLPHQPVVFQQDSVRDSMKVEQEIVQGFRIQIFSSSNIDEAGSMKLLAQEKFPSDSLYIVFDPPVYKVRVGDFSTRYDAGQRLSQFVDLGYRDAWIVPDRIIKRKLVPSEPAHVH
jgi:SPOR domain